MVWMRRGYTNTMTTLILFIGAVLAVSVAVSAMGYMLKQYQNAMEIKTRTSTLQTLSILSFITGSGDTNYLWFYVKNVGKTNLDVNKMNVYVDNVLVGPCNSANVICTDENTDYVLIPGEVLDVNVQKGYPAGSHDVKVDTEYGSYVSGTVVVP